MKSKGSVSPGLQEGGGGEKVLNDFIDSSGSKVNLVASKPDLSVVVVQSEPPTLIGGLTR